MVLNMRNENVVLRDRMITFDETDLCRCPFCGRNIIPEAFVDID